MLTMIGHIGFYVENLQQSDLFYRPLLKCIGYEVIFERSQCIAYGINSVPIFEIYTDKPRSSGIHIAFNVPDKETVEYFYNQGLELGAKDNGKPGFRDYCPGYYAAFIIDPHGNNLEALFCSP
jgi:catechol 2,3-dioxygenase-like lactoylglutathione lyase family enzyme